MTGWIIFGAIVALILVILFIPVQALIEYKDDMLYVMARYAFVRYRLLPADPKRAAKREQKKLKKEQREAAKGKPAAAKKEPEKRTLSETVGMVRDILESLHTSLRHILKRVKLTDIAFYMKTVGETPAETAVEVGRVNAYVYGCYAFLLNFFQVSDPDILITPDYYGEKSQTYFRITIGITPAAALRASLTFGWKLIALLVFKKLIGKNVEKTVKQAQ